MDRIVVTKPTKEDSMTLAEAIEQYEARREEFGVEMSGGMCIAEDHTGHNH